MKMICPYCSRPLKIKNIMFRCMNDAIDTKTGDRKCPQVDDEEFSEYNKLAHVMPKNLVFPAKGVFFSIPRESRCPSCNMISKKRVCQFCHNELPAFFGETDNITIAVIGAKSAGKSHYIAVLKRILENELSGPFNYSMIACNDETIGRYEKEFRDPLFNEHVTLDATMSSVVNVKTKSPLIYMIQFYAKDARKISKTVTITFFDTAGENLDSSQTMLAENQYIVHSDGIIMLLDPLQLPILRQELERKGMYLPTANTDSGDILDRTVQLIKEQKNLNADAIIDIPLAVAFTKMDVLMDQLLASSYFRNQSPHRLIGAFDVDDFNTINDEMRSYVEKWNGGGFVQKANAFKEKAFFGLSALGCNPDELNGTVPIVAPMRVEDPFLWLLYKNKFIPGTK